MRRGDQFCAQLLRDGGIADPALNELRKTGFIELLQLAAATLAKVAARRLNVMRPRLERAVRAQQVARRSAPSESARYGDAIALGSDTDDFFGLVSHRHAA